jgi:uncharacterized protein
VLFHRRRALLQRSLAAPTVLAAVVVLGACAAPRSRAPEPAEGATRESLAPPASTAPPPSPSLAIQGDYLEVEVATVGWDALSNAPLVLLREQTTGQVVPIWVGVAEARAIAAALEEVEMPRPMTHDLMANLLTKLDARVEELLIHDLIDGTYYALLALKPHGAKDGEPLLVDTRPSDGIALALRLGAPIRIARKILAESPDFEFLAPEGSDQVVRAFGLTVVAPTAELRQRFHIPERPGLVITRALGEAASKGLRRGDLLVEVAGAVPTEPVQFLDAVRNAPLDRPIPITYWRDGEEHRTELNPAERKEEAEKGPAQVA